MTILLYLLSLLLMQQPGQTQLGTISGQLRESTGAPAAGLRVFATPVESAAGEALATLSSIARTDSDGRYQLEGLLPGRYLIAAGLLDSPSYYPGVATRSQGQILTIGAGQAITSLDFAIARRSGPPQLWGMVEFDDGSSLPVGTLQQVLLVLSSESMHWTTRPFTNQQGIFTFRSVAPGDYFFTLAPLPLRYGYLKSMTFGNVDLSRTPLTVTGGLNATEIDATEIKVVLTKTPPAGTPPGVKVSGRVSNPAPLVLNRVLSVIDQVHPENVTNPVVYVTPREDGFFEIEGVPPGRYTLGPRVGKVSAPLEVAGNDVTNLVLDFPTSGPRGGRGAPRFPVALSSTSIRSISGRVEVGDGTIPQFEVAFSTTRAVPAATHKAVVSGKDFAIPVPEGEYRISVSGLPNGYTVESVTAGPLDLTEPFLVTNKGIADRFTGSPVLTRSTGPTPAAVTVKLKAPSSGK